MKEFHCTKNGNLYEFYENEAEEVGKVFPNKPIYNILGSKSISFKEEEIYPAMKKLFQVGIAVTIPQLSLSRKKMNQAQKSFE